MDNKTKKPEERAEYRRRYMQEYMRRYRADNPDRVHDWRVNAAKAVLRKDGYSVKKLVIPLDDETDLVIVNPDKVFKDFQAPTEEGGEDA